MTDSRLEEIFSAAMAKSSTRERQAYLDGVCQHEADLRARVESLLRAHDEAGDFLSPVATNKTGDESENGIIGRYKLLQRIGEGGFGVVYMAEQLEPVRRKVALKIIKLGMDTKQVVARFESERQALALMDHPNIARVLDAGATETGRPYFVMELVRGIPITDYCDQNTLSLEDRLQLFLPVCHAVQHAHQKGIIHRDIKPSNVLVTLHDGVPVPKVIDFGIAKATNQRLTEKTLFTEFKQFIGTPQYMSPEQAEMSGLDVDTRSDIYSLGVLLYELLTGSTPFEAERLRSAGYSEMQRIIREEDPPSPSQRVSTIGDQLATVAKRRSADPGSLTRLFRGDLDWIVMKALEKDRTRRYGTANDLASDLVRYLRHELVLAGPPSPFYRAKKFVRRNRFAVMAGVLVALALLIGFSVAAYGFWQARREADRSQQIADFLQQILSASDPQAVAAREIDVPRVETRARELFGDDHASVASVLTSLGTQLERSGKLDQAEAAFQEAVQVWKSLYGKNHAQVGITLSHLGTLQHRKGNDVEAEESLREAIQITSDLPDAGKLIASDARSELAKILKQRGNLPEAETLLREALRIRRLSPTGQEYFIASDLEHLTAVLTQAGKDDAAEEAFLDLLTVCRPLFPDDSAPRAWQNAAFGLWLRQRGKSEKAEPYLREALRIYRLMENPPRDLYLATVDALFQAIRRRDESVDESIRLFKECIENMHYVYGKDHLLVAPHLVGFAKELEDRDRSAEAISLLIEGIRIYRKGQGGTWNATPTLETLERFVRRVCLPGNSAPEKYEIGEQGAMVLKSEQPRRAAAILLVGIAQFRLGKCNEAGITFSEIADLLAQGEPPLDEQDECLRLAFQVLISYQLGDTSIALDAFMNLQRELDKLQNPLDKQYRSVIAEAQMVFNGKS